MSNKNLFSILVIYAIWGFICSKTVYGSPSAVYISFSILFLLFFLNFIKSPKKIDSVAKIWIPYILLYILRIALKGDMEMFVYWTIPLFLLLTNSLKDFENVYPYKVLFICGIISLLGIAVQIAIPNFYYSYINNIFTDTSTLESWSEDEYGYAGFTYQLGTTAMPIIYALPILLYANNRNYRVSHNNLIRITLISLLIVGVFLTGKRSLALCALSFPILIPFLTSRLSGKKIVISIIIFFICALSFSYFINHPYEFIDNAMLRRFAESVIDLSMGGDVSSGRSDLYALAFNAFEDHPLLGIGPGQFIPYTKAYTSVHNTYLEVLCEQGIVGTLLYIIPLLFCLFKTISLLRSRNNQLLKISLFVQLLYIAYAMTGNVNSELSTFGIYFLSLGFLQTSSKINTQ